MTNEVKKRANSYPVVIAVLIVIALSIALKHVALDRYGKLMSEEVSALSEDTVQENII